MGGRDGSVQFCSWSWTKKRNVAKALQLALEDTWKQRRRNHGLEMPAAIKTQIEKVGGMDHLTVSARFEVLMLGSTLVGLHGCFISLFCFLCFLCLLVKQSFSHLSLCFTHIEPGFPLFPPPRFYPFRPRKRFAFRV